RKMTAIRSTRSLPCLGVSSSSGPAVSSLITDEISLFGVVYSICFALKSVYGFFEFVTSLFIFVIHVKRGTSGAEQHTRSSFGPFFTHTYFFVHIFCSFKMRNNGF